MNATKLNNPIADLKKEYGVMLDDWISTGEQLIPIVLRFNETI